MKKHERLIAGILLMCSNWILAASASTGVADPNTYLQPIVTELQKKWPHNRTINIVCHGHSVPSGYFKTPIVDTFNAYPHLLHRAMKEQYPYAVINVIVTSIGGEASNSGSKRFQNDVLSHRPDVLLIDYGLNDRRLGLDKAKAAWMTMIEQALNENVKVILLTPTLDIKHVPGDSEQPLNQHAEQIRGLAKKYHIGLVDSLSAFDKQLEHGAKNIDFLSNGYNHPNRKGHELVVNELVKWFTPTKQ